MPIEQPYHMNLFVILVVILTVWGVAWIPIIESTSSGQLFLYGQEVVNYLAPPIAAIFVLSVMWRGCSETGAFWGLVLGTVIGIGRLSFMFLDATSVCSLDYDEPWILQGMIRSHIWAKLLDMSCSSLIRIELRKLLKISNTPRHFKFG